MLIFVGIVSTLLALRWIGLYNWREVD